MQNPNFLKDGVDTEENEMKSIKTDPENTSNQETVPEGQKNYGKMILNRALLLLGLLALLIVLASLRSIKVVDNRTASNSTTPSKPMF